MRLHPRSGALATAAATVLLLAGCGGGDEEATTPAPEATETTAPEATPEETPAPETAAAEGEEIFSQQCASCHALEAANASGQVGPDLDRLDPDAETVERKVIAGGGGMPSFQGQLSPEEIDAVSQYVAEAAGR